MVSRIEGSVAVIHLDGRFMSGEPVEEFRARWAQALAAGARDFVVNLAGVSMIDSSGMGALVRCQSGVAALGGRMKLAAANETVMLALKFTRLDRSFEFHRDEASAMAALAGK